MTLSRRNALKLLLPVGFIGSLLGVDRYLKYKKNKETIKSGDLNDFIEEGRFFINGSVSNSPSRSGWLNVSTSNSGNAEVLQQFFDFDNPSILLVRKKHKVWSEWGLLHAKQALPFDGRKIVCLGDSITGSFRWPAKMAGIAGGNIINCGISGTTASLVPGDFGMLSLASISRAINTEDWGEIRLAAEKIYLELKKDYRKTVENLSKIKWDEIDAIIIFYGTNDFSKNVRIENELENDASSYKGAINSSIEKILTKHPSLRIFFISPMWRSKSITDLNNQNEDSDILKNEVGSKLIDYVNATIEISSKNKVPCLDMYRNSGFNKYNKDLMFIDGLHPSEVGENRIAEKISSFVVANY